MTWVMVGVAAVGAVKGGLDAKENRKQAREHDAFRKKAIALSPWTGMSDPGQGNFGETNGLSAMIGGGMQGAMIGQSFGGGPQAAGASSTGASAMADPAAMNSMQLQSTDPMQYIQQQPGGGQSPWKMMA